MRKLDIGDYYKISYEDNLAGSVFVYEKGGISLVIYTATCEEWEKIQKQNEFISNDFHKDGFIHCSYPNQTIWVLNKHYINREKVILLCINPNLLKSKFVNEDLKGRGEVFPHVYGSVNIDSIVKVIDIHRSIDGVFYENEELKNLILDTRCI